MCRTDPNVNVLIGPVPHVRSTRGGWVPDYSRPGVAERIRAEVDLIEAIEWRREK